VPTEDPTVRETSDLGRKSRGNSDPQTAAVGESLVSNELHKHSLHIHALGLCSAAKVKVAW